jgi:putative PIN family toxin of toxin-antitoxin system
LRVLLDTNVIVAAFATRGLCADLFEVCLEKHTVIISQHILSEVEKSLIKKIHLPQNITRYVISYLQDITEFFVPEHVDKSLCRDRDDLKILGTALSGNAKIIITGDKDLLALKKFGKISILTPRDFWSLLNK